jgi:hypothetical protein
LNAALVYVFADAFDVVAAAVAIVVARGVTDLQLAVVGMAQPAEPETV